MTIGGLQELPQDDRDLQLGSFWSLPQLEELPEEFSFEPLWIGDQNAEGEDDFCSAYATCGASSLQEDKPLYPAYSFALSKQLTGDPEAWGQNLRAAMKAHQKFGAVPTNVVTQGVRDIDPNGRRYIQNYPGQYEEFAEPYRKKSYWKIVGPYDAYDDLRAAIWKFHGERKAPVIGLVWSWPLARYELNTVGDGFGHAMYIIGWNKDGLLAVNSAGKGAGKGGIHVVSRQVINEYVPRYGAYMFTDMPPEEAKKVVEAGIKETDNRLTDRVKRVIMALTLWFK